MMGACPGPPVRPVVGGHGERRSGRRHAMHAHVGNAALGLGLGLAITLGTIIAPRAGAGAQQEAPMTAAATRATMAAYFDALLGGGAYEAFFAAGIVLTLTGVPGEV